jgi:hypothetical protein
MVNGRDAASACRVELGLVLSLWSSDSGLLDQGRGERIACPISELRRWFGLLGPTGAHLNQQLLQRDPVDPQSWRLHRKRVANSPGMQ